MDFQRGWTGGTPDVAILAIPKAVLQWTEPTALNIGIGSKFQSFMWSRHELLVSSV